MLELIKGLQERVSKLETQVAGAEEAKATDGAPVAAGAEHAPPDGTAGAPPPVPPAGPAKAPQGEERKKGFGTYTPNLGFKLVDTEYGDINVSIYTYVRYLNQLGLDATYTDAFGNTKNVQQRQDVQLLKLQIKFLGWILNPKLRYFLYAWTSNANQGQGAQVVLAGNLQYTFNKYITLGGGITIAARHAKRRGQLPVLARSG